MQRKWLLNSTSPVTLEVAVFMTRHGILRRCCRRWLLGAEREAKRQLIVAHLHDSESAMVSTPTSIDGGATSGIAEGYWVESDNASDEEEGQDSGHRGNSGVVLPSCPSEHRRLPK